MLKMVLSESQKNAIIEEFENWCSSMYAGKTLEERQKLFEKLFLRTMQNKRTMLQ